MDRIFMILNKVDHRGSSTETFTITALDIGLFEIVYQ